MFLRLEIFARDEKFMCVEPHFKIFHQCLHVFGGCLSGGLEKREEKVLKSCSYCIQISKLKYEMNFPGFGAVKHKWPQHIVWNLKLFMLRGLLEEENGEGETNPIN
jgi:hypothetical protein